MNRPMTKVATPLEAARGLLPLIRERIPEMEAARRLSDDLVDAFTTTGLFDLLLPAEYGGAEIAPLDWLELIEEVAAADGSTGWTLMIGAGTTYFAGFLEPEVASSIWNRPGVVTAGSFVAARGRATRHGDGFRLEGQWSYCSGVSHASWLMLNCRVEQTGGADLPPVAKAAFLPVDEGTILDTWDAVGLRGTGSHDVRVDGVIVPANRFHQLGVDPPRVAGAIYRLPLGAYLRMTLVGVLLGLARAALAELAQVAAVQVPGGGANTAVLRERPLTQAGFARMTARVGAARAYLHDSVGRAWDSLQRGEPVPRRVGLEIELAALHAAHTCRQATAGVLELGGARALYSASPIQRIFRDTHAGSQHAALLEDVYIGLGQELLAAPAPEQ